LGRLFAFGALEARHQNGGVQVGVRDQTAGTIRQTFAPAPSTTCCRRSASTGARLRRTTSRSATQLNAKMMSPPVRSIARSALQPSGNSPRTAFTRFWEPGRGSSRRQPSVRSASASAASTIRSCRCSRVSS
jgi:hypothetical protein